MDELPSKPHLGALTQDRLEVPHPLKNSDDFQRSGLRIVDHDIVRVAANRPESKRLARQICADVPTQRPFRQKRRKPHRWPIQPGQQPLRCRVRCSSRFQRGQFLLAG
jgi:hypothetical protein